MKQPGEMGLLVIRSQSEPWEMLAPEAERRNYSGESSPTVSAEVQTLCLGVTLPLQPHIIKAQKTL